MTGPNGFISRSAWFAKAIGVAAGIAVSLRVIGQHLTHDLGPLVALWVQAYQTLLYPIIDVIWSPVRIAIGYELLPISKDILTIYILVGAAAARGVYSYLMTEEYSEGDSFKTFAPMVLSTSTLWPLTAIYAIVITIRGKHEIPTLPEALRSLGRYTGLELIYIAVGTASVIFISLGVQKVVTS